MLHLKGLSMWRTDEFFCIFSRFSSKGLSMWQTDEIFAFSAVFLLIVRSGCLSCCPYAKKLPRRVWGNLLHCHVGFVGPGPAARFGWRQEKPMIFCPLKIKAHSLGYFVLSSTKGSLTRMIHSLRCFWNFFRF